MTYLISEFDLLIFMSFSLLTCNTSEFEIVENRYLECQFVNTSVLNWYLECLFVNKYYLWVWVCWELIPSLPVCYFVLPVSLRLLRTDTLSASLSIHVNSEFEPGENWYLECQFVNICDLWVWVCWEWILWVPVC